MNVDVVSVEGDNLRGVVGILRGGGFHKFPMQVDDLGGAGSLMEVIYILGDDGDIEELLQSCHQLVTAAGLHQGQLPAAFVVEVNHEFGITDIALNGGHILYAVLFP